MKLINQPSYIVKKFTENFAWNHFGKIFEYFLVYIFSILIARRISVEDNGIFVTLISLCQILLVISEIGTDVSLNKSVSEFITLGNKEKIRFLFRKITLLKFLVFIFFTFLIYLFKDLISNFLEISNEIFTKYFTVLILYSGLRIFISTFINILIGQLNLKIILLVNIPARIIEVLSIYLFLNLDRSLLFIFYIIILSSLFSLILFLLFGRKIYLGKVEKFEIKPVIWFGIIYWVNGVMSYVFGKQVNVLMLSTLSKDIEQVAFFDVAYNLMQGVTYATTIGFYGISIATFSRLIIINPEKVSEFWNFLVKITTLLIVPLLIFVVYYSDIIIKFLYTDKYNESVKFFIVYVFFVIITRLLGAGINADIMISSDNVKWLTVFGIISALINVVLNCLLIPKYQGLGAIIGLGGANLIVGILNFSFIRLTLKCRLPLLFWIKVILISIFSIGVCKVIIHSSRTIISSGGTLFLSFIIFYSVFVSLSFIIKLFSAKDKEWLQYIGIIKL